MARGALRTNFAIPNYAGNWIDYHRPYILPIILSKVLSIITGSLPHRAEGSHLRKSQIADNTRDPLVIEGQDWPQPPEKKVSKV